MKKIFIVISIFCCIKAQNFDLFLKELKKNYTIKNNDFFVVQCKTNIELYTNAPAIIRRFREIKNHQVCKFVYFICYDGAGVGDSIIPYFKKNFYVDTNAVTKIIVNKKLYSLLGDVKNSRIIYFKDNKLYGIYDGKYDNLQKTLKYDLIKIKSKKDYSWDKKNGFHSATSRYYPINDTLAIELADSQEDRIRLTNIRNGKILKIFPLYDNINYMEIIFKKFEFAKNLDKKSVKKMDSIFRNLKRTPLRIENIYVKNKDTIFFVGDITLYFPSRKDFYVPGDYWSTKKVKKGEITNMDIGIILLTDEKFKIKDTFFINPSDSIFMTKFVTYANGIYMNSNEKKFYFSCYNFNNQTDSTYQKFYESNRNTKILISFLIDKNKILRFHQIHAPQNKQPFEKFFGYEDFKIWGTNKGNVYISNAIFPEIYHKDYDTSFLKVINDNKIENEYKLYEMHKDYNKNFEDNVPFSVIDIFTIEKGKFLIMVYFYKSKVYINCYLPNMNLLQTLDITRYLNKDLINKLLEFEVSTYITDKRIFFAYVNNKENYVFLDLEYELSEYNENYFEYNNEIFIK